MWEEAAGYGSFSCAGPAAQCGFEGDGGVADEDARGVYDGDVEGFGMVFLEANAAGKPVIGGRSGGTSEAILDGETGFLVDPSEDRELRDALRTLLNDDKLRQAIGAAGLRRARNDFSWDTRASTVQKISRIVANSSKSST